MSQIDRRIVIVNPLPEALHHYCLELIDVIQPRETPLEIEPSQGIEGLAPTAKVIAVVRTLFKRLTARYRNCVLVVVWPALGYFDSLTWLRLAKKNQVILVIHDVTPLRKQFGYSPLARSAFRHAVRRGNFQVVCHTDAAAEELLSVSGVSADVASHPILSSEVVAASRGSSVRVMGQFKEARTLDPLRSIAENFSGDQTYSLEIFGRAWPEVSGWSVKSTFLPESEFDQLIRTAGCVVLPYARFYQSGVAIRCLESGIPVVTRRHPQMLNLYGEKYAGYVDGEDWAGAVVRATSIPASELKAMLDSAHSESVNQWRELL